MPGGPIGPKPGLHRSGPLHEELHGGRYRQTSHRHHDLAGNAERLPARSDQPEARHRSHQVVGKRGSLVDEVFAVVEDDDERTPGQVAHDELRG
jgi:hypothetical protein